MATEFLCLSRSSFFRPRLFPARSKCPSQTQMKLSVHTNTNTVRSGVSNFQICHGTSSPPPTESRRSAYYEPSSWDYNMLQSLGSTGPQMDDKGYKDKADMLKEEVRCLIRDDQAKSSDVLQLIDDIQRLGLKNHFEDDIISALHRILPSEVFSDEDGAISSLHYVSLRFRLLRQHGFEVSQGVFEKLKGEDGEFKEKLSEDVKGMLSLYEASKLGFEGETILNEANAFTCKHLTNAINIPPVKPIAGKIKHALELPFHRRMRRLEARWTIENYDAQSNNANGALLRLAKSDFNSVQSIHQAELRDLTRWWKALGLSDKLSFARERLIECHFWSVRMVSEPQYDKCRKALTKVAYFITVLDDVYDVYGTMDELELFTSAVERWDVSMVNELPDYMKLCFLALYNTINEIAYEILQERGISVITYLAKAWADLFKTFLQEAKWSSVKYTPSFQEYLDNAWLSSSGPLLLVHAYFFMSHNISTADLEYLQNYRALLRLPSLIFRLCNDSATSKAEIEKGDVAKAVLCYMKETGKTEEEGREHIANMIEETWKKLNKEATISNSSSFSKAFVKTALDLARVAHCHYQYGDGHGAPDSRSKNRVISLFIQPISLD